MLAKFSSTTSTDKAKHEERKSLDPWPAMQIFLRTDSPGSSGWMFWCLKFAWSPLKDEQGHSSLGSDACGIAPNSLAEFIAYLIQRLRYFLGLFSLVFLLNILTARAWKSLGTLRPLWNGTSN